MITLRLEHALSDLDKLVENIKASFAKDREARKILDKDAIDYFKFAKDSTDSNDEYSRGMRNGIELCIAYIEGKDPVFEKGKNND